MIMIINTPDYGNPDNLPLPSAVVFKAHEIYVIKSDRVQVYKGEAYHVTNKSVTIKQVYAAIAFHETNRILMESTLEI